jgi:SAM-dependent methyltransferase
MQRSSQLKSFYEDKIRSNRRDTPWKASKINQIVDVCHLRAQRVLEVGCGSGAIIADVSQRLQAWGWGLDISKKMLKVAVQEFLSVQFVEGDALALPFATDTYDLCLLVDVVEHVPQPRQVLEEALRVSHHVILKVPIEYNLWRRFQHYASIFTWEDSRITVGHLFWWNYRGVRELVEGFNVIHEELVSIFADQPPGRGILQRPLDLTRKGLFHVSKKLYKPLFGGDVVFLLRR